MLDTTGALGVMQAGLALLAPRGTFGFVSNSHGGVPLELALGPMLSGGRALRGIVQGDSDPHRFIPMLIDLYLQGRFPFDQLIRLYKFVDINEAIADSEAGRAIKPVLHIFEA